MTDVYSELRIERLPDGGFTVSEGHMPGMGSRSLFASSSIGEALAFISGRLDPEASRPAANVREASPKRCDICGSAGMERYCSVCNGGKDRKCGTCGLFLAPGVTCATCGRGGEHDKFKRSRRYDDAGGWGA